MIKVPQGKQIRIRRGTQDIAGGVPLIVEEDITLSLSSNFSPLLGGGDTKMLNAIGGIAGHLSGGRFAFSGQFKQLGFQQWGGTDPLAFSVTLGFFMGSTEANDAKTEVYEPMIKLASLPLPEEGSGGNLIGPGPSITEAVIPGVVEGTSNKIISLEIARILRIDSIIVKRAEPIFNNETDDKGYPISGKIQLDINSLFTASVQMLTNRNFEVEKEASVLTGIGNSPTDIYGNF